MADQDHRDRIRALVSAGELDQALDTLDRADAEGRTTDLDLLVPLTRALLLQGRNHDAQGILERGRHRAVFGEDLENIATEVGFPLSSPLPSDTEPELNTKLPLRDRAQTLRDMEPPPWSGFGRSMGGDDLDTPLEPRKFDTSRTLEKQLALDEELLDTPLRPMSLECDTELVRIPRAEPATSGGGAEATKPAHIESDELDTDEVELPRRAVTPSPETELPQEKEQEAFDPNALQYREESVTSPVSIIAEGEGLTQRLQIPAEDEWDTAEHMLQATSAAQNTKITWTTPDTSVNDTNEVELDEEEVKPRRARRDTIQNIVRKARDLRQRIGDITAKLQIQDVEIVGSFESGKRQRPAPYQPSSYYDDPSKEIDFSQIPDSEDLRHPFDEPSDDDHKREPLPDIKTEITSTERHLEDADHVESPRRPKGTQPLGPRRRRLLIPTLAVSGVILILSVSLWGWRRQARSNELRQVHDLLATDTYESHREALGVLEGLKDSLGGVACVEFAAESALMWGRFGLGQDYGDDAARALSSCSFASETEPGFLTQALLALYDDELAQGVRTCDLALTAHPQSARIRTVLGWTREALGEPEAAIQALRAAREVDPHYIPATLSLARLLRRAGGRGETRLLLEEIRTESPGHVEARVEEMMLALDVLESTQPSPASLDEIRTMASALETAAVDQPPAISSQLLVARGRFALIEGNVEHGGFLLGRAWRQGSTSKEAVFYVARGLRLTGDVAGALEVSRPQPNESPELALERIRSSLAAGRPAQALDGLGAAMKTAREAGRSHGISPQIDEDVLVRLEASALAQSGDLPGASSLLEAHLRDHGDDEARLLLAEIVMEQGQWERSLGISREIKARPWSLCADASRHELFGEHRQALDSLNSIGSRRTPCALRLRSVISKNTGDPISEISSLRSLMRVESRFEDRVTLARAVWRERGATAALTELRSVFDAPPTGARPLLELVDLLAEMKGMRQIERLTIASSKAGAEPTLIASVKARVARLDGHPERAIEILDELPARPLPFALIERGAALIQLDDYDHSFEVLSAVEAEAGSKQWVSKVALMAKASSSGVGHLDSDLILERAIREAEELGNLEAVQKLSLHRVELALDSRRSRSAVRSLLKQVPASPPNPEIFFLAGRIAEEEGEHRKAVEAYRLALEVTPSHLASLRRLVALTKAPEYGPRLAMFLLNDRDEESTGGGALEDER